MAWKKARDRDIWHQVVSKATLCRSSSLRRRCNSSRKPKLVAGAVWLMLKVYREEIESNPAVRHSISGLSGVNQYSIELRDQNVSSAENRVIVAHDMRSLIKSCETLAFLVRDAAHITPHNFAACVHTIRTFVVASVDGGELFCRCLLYCSLLARYN